MAGSLHSRGVCQGCVISCNNLTPEFLELIQRSRAIERRRSKPILGTDSLIVLSQDCDIAQARDSYIEVAEIRPVTNPRNLSPLLQKARNYRKLQILVDGNAYECDVEKISIVPKSDLVAQNFTISGLLMPRIKELVIDWRISRYNRIPFPDRFNEVLFSVLKDHEQGVASQLEKIVEINDIYAFLHSNEDGLEKYEVIICALVDEDTDSLRFEEVGSVIRDLCEKLHQKESYLHMLQVDASGPSGRTYDVPPEYVQRPSDLTFLDGQKLRRITLDFLCYSDLDDAA